MPGRILNICTIVFFILPLCATAQDTLPKYMGTSGLGRDPFVNGSKLEGRNMVEKTVATLNTSCHEQGVVVMAVTVDKAGNVIEAVAGRGTTNLAPCLVEQAKAAALKTKFNPDPNAPEKQRGSVKYDFKLTD